MQQKPSFGSAKVNGAKQLLWSAINTCVTYKYYGCSETTSLERITVGVGHFPTLSSKKALLHD